MDSGKSAGITRINQLREQLVDIEYTVEDFYGSSIKIFTRTTRLGAGLDLPVKLLCVCALCLLETTCITNHFGSILRPLNQYQQCAWLQFSLFILTLNKAIIQTSPSVILLKWC